MKKRVFIVHGWDGDPEDGWFPWLKQELESKGFAVAVPAMPHPEMPTIKDWVAHLATVVGEPDADTYFVGHSMGCQTIIRYLAGLADDKKVGGAVFVAGFFMLEGLKDEDEEEIARPWIDYPIDFAKVKNHTEKFTAIFSDDDEFVPLDNKSLFQHRLGAKTIVEYGMGHFSGEDEIMELPVALKEILEISGS